jgi:hypothetical protein
VAISRDGVGFEARPDVLGRTYMRVFEHDGYRYAMSIPGCFYRSKDRLTGFEEGPLLFNPDMRHSALLKRRKTLYVFWTQVGHAPERILLSAIDISGEWTTWSETADWRARVGATPSSGVYFSTTVFHQCDPSGIAPATPTRRSSGPK